MKPIDITMFISQDEIEQEIARIRLQERLRGRTLTADEIADSALDLPHLSSTKD
jgi:hypothetical protein